MRVTNPYQDIIDWLHSPAGEQWSEERMRKARTRVVIHDDELDRIITSTTLVSYGYRQGPLYLGGVLSVKDG